MKDSFDIEAIIFDLLSNSAMKNAINGGIYVGDGRPADSEDEDVVINTISLTQDYLPQLATTNVNIYVKDGDVTIKGKEQKQANRTRLKALSEKAMTILRNAKFDGLMITIESQTILAESSIKQHYSNIRISWNIQK